MERFETKSWDQYELIDTGNGQKLERFGAYILARPEPKAIWEKALPAEEWNRRSHAYFKKTRGETADREETGEWIRKPSMPDQWKIEYPIQGFKLNMRLGLTPFRHVGLFPEQAVNWEYIYHSVKRIPLARPRVLNLFAYTGAASLAARAAGADVVHVEALKQLISWTRENMEMNGLDQIRWMLDDAVKFVKREVRRGNRYHGVILDPPSYGRGPNGEKWILEDGIMDLLKDIHPLLDPDNRFLVLNLYSKGTSPMITENLADCAFGKNIPKECGELFIKDHAGRKLPYGSLLRFCKISSERKNNN